MGTNQVFALGNGLISSPVHRPHSKYLCSSAAGLLFDPDVFDAVYLLNSLMEREFAKAHCDLTTWEECEDALHQILQPSAAASYQTMRPCVFVAEKVKVSRV